MKRILPFLIVMVTVAAIACGGADTTAEEPEAPPAAAAAPAPSRAAPEPATAPEPTGQTTRAEVESRTAARVAAEAADAEPLPGGVFRRLWADPPTLDPHLTQDTTSAGVVVEIFSGLVALDTNLQLVPDIAHKWEIENGVVYTFYLRPNVTFHNGKPVTAHDFKWSIERASDSSNASPVSDTYLDDIVGFNDYWEGRGTEITGIKVIDDLTLQITIDAPKAYFLAKLTYPTAYVLDRETVEAGGRGWWVDNPVGTGAFRLKEYRIGERIVLERFDEYYREPAKVDRVVMNLAGGQAMAMYENDEIDITGVGLFDLDRVLDPNEPLNKDLVVAPPGFSVSYIGFNTNQPPLDDQKFRLALNHAVDKELISKEVLSELVVPAYGILPPGFPGFNPNLKGLEFDADLAARLLSESKYSDPETRPRIVVTVPGTGGTIGLDLEVIIEMWRQVLGVDVEIQQVEWATYLDELDNQSFQAYGGLGWAADYPDPQDFLDILFHSASPINHGGYTNLEVDSVLEEARTEPDPIQRVALYHEAEQLIIDDAALLPLWYSGEDYVLIKPNVKGYKLTPMIVPKLREVSVEG